MLSVSIVFLRRKYYFSVWEYTFAPREYLHQHLETRFSRAIAGMVMYNPETGEIAKPSELLASVKAYMSVLQSVENYVNIDITRVFNNVLLQQTQQVRFKLIFKKCVFFNRCIDA